MQIVSVLSFLLLLLSWVSPTTQGHEPVPAPDSGDGVGSRSVDYSPRATTSSFITPAPSPVSGVRGDETPSEEIEEIPPAPTPAGEEEGHGDDQDNTESNEVPEETDSSGTVKWCVVRDEFDDCKNYLTLLNQIDGYTWKCVRRETIQECLDSIKKGEADLINLDAGMAYIAFLKYSMKAIANEVYCNHAESFDAVAVINRKACSEREVTSLIDFKGRRSCHGSHSTASGWNYPVNHLKELVGSKEKNVDEMVGNFFSGVCAPSEFQGTGICSGCGSGNGSCHTNSLYSGDSGAFRCLVEELGDIAFVRGDTALLYSMEGPQKQTWSTKSIRDFMYLCPQGGCREINGYPGSCSFGTVPANVVMASNSISREKRSVVLKTLLNGTWGDTLSTSKNGGDHILSSSAQRLYVVKKITRSYLGVSASISQSIQELKNSSSTINSTSDVSSPSTRNAQHLSVVTAFSIIVGLMVQVFSMW
ncbi:serotransferrin-like [Macadamia integrifolia]|uniref:serotransferrin-like n=1 Tax=Macadamia integrifolia TaxID=60698 RepID=UPI001C5342A4|nr:serotransferrin-like [Macadamia integrifolia]